MKPGKTRLNPGVILFCFLLAGCNTATVKTTSHEKAIAETTTAIPEDLLLDVGIGIFNPGVDALSAPEKGVYPKIREAEARFMPVKLKETLQNTGNWGAVRVVPDKLSEMDIRVDAEILKSDGENLWLQVTVKEASGRRWFSRKYTEVAGKYSYDSAIAGRAEPFQGAYNKIANDMLLYRNQLNPDEIKAIRTIAELKFAKDFSPVVFAEHLEIDSKGRYSITRLPSDNDPILYQVRQIRERDYMFVDTLQEYYASFVRQMQAPYREWREAYYLENKALKEVKSQANTRLVGGALAVLAGILAQGVDSRTVRNAGAVGIGAGATAIYSGLQKREEAKIHVEALEEISTSLHSEIEPHTLTLEDRTVTLSGTVHDQYRQWRQILKEIYETETGSTGANTAP